VEEREKIAAELEELLGPEIEDSIGELYGEEPAAIGVALSYLDCGCVFLRCFDQSGELIGNLKILETRDSCPTGHTNNLEEIGQTAVYNSIFWRDSREEFDHKYGNEKRMDIASKLFPPPLEE
jgi:hypothetical protein